MVTEEALNKACKEYDKQVLKKKQDTSVEDLCEGLPKPFNDFLLYCRFLTWDAKPDYAYLKGLLTGLFEDMTYKHDG